MRRTQFAFGAANGSAGGNQAVPGIYRTAIAEKLFMRAANAIESRERYLRGCKPHGIEARVRLSTQIPYRLVFIGWLYDTG